MRRLDQTQAGKKKVIRRVLRAQRRDATVLFIEKLEHSLGLSVVSCIEGGITHLHPEPDLIPPTGCQVLVLATLDILQKLNSFNKQKLKEK
jgi:hypothetical protein